MKYSRYRDQLPNGLRVVTLEVPHLHSVMLAVYAVVYLFEGAPTGFMTLLTLVLLMGSLQFLCLAVIGDYVGRVLEEVKARPHYIVGSVLNDPRTRTETPPREAP